MPAFLAPVDLSAIPVVNLALERRTTDHSSPVEALCYWHTGTKTLRIYDGSNYVSVGGAGIQGIGVTAPLQSTGGSSPTLSIAAASGSAAGSMSASHFTLVNGATASNTNSTLVLRDSSGNFAAGTITASLTGTASNAGNLNGQAPSFYLNRGNHTGTQAAATISDLATVVQGYRLDQFAAPNTNLGLNSQRIINVADPQNPQDAATKAYVDAARAGLDVKDSVRVATTANINLASPGATIDGVTMVAGDRVLVKDQSTGSQNGIYVWNGAAVAMTRSTDADQGVEVTSGLYVFVEQGTAHDNAGFVLTTNNPITVGTTALTFAQFTGAGSIVAGNGLTQTGNTFDVGGGTGITVNADSIQLDLAVAVRKFVQQIGDGTSTSISVTHNLNNSTPQWFCRRSGGNEDYVIPDVRVLSANTLQVNFFSAPSANEFTFAVQG